MNIIRQLDPAVIAQISAGEVIERPVSVVKELVENAIDAGSTHIVVRILEGGKKRIEVKDNGVGMSKENLSLSTLRHATSKIESVEDLLSVASLGFRGEALASILAVSKLTISTRECGVTSGHILTAINGVIEIEEAPHLLEGTTVIAEDLFYNTTPRLKFLKKDSTESGLITDLILKLALSQPNIAFECHIDGRKVLQTTGKGGTLNAIASLYGMDYSKKSIEVIYHGEGLTITGFVGKPALHRSNRKGQSFFVNGRLVTGPALSIALEKAYSGLVTVGKYPFSVLYIDIDPGEIDVNFHPTKSLVRFSNERMIFYSIGEAVRLALSSESLFSEVIFEKPKKEDPKPNHLHEDKLSFEPKKEITFIKKEDSSVQHTSAPGENELKTEATNGPLEEKTIEEKNITKPSLRDVDFKDLVKPSSPSYNEVASSKTHYGIISDKPKVTNNQRNIATEQEESQTSFMKETPTAQLEDDRNMLHDLVPIAIFKKLYIIAIDGNDLYLIDQHAAHERIVYEKWVQTVKNHSVISQLLLMPMHYTLSHRELTFLEEHHKNLEEIGFGFDFFGHNEIILREVPVLLGAIKENLFLEVIDASIEQLHGEDVFTMDHAETVMRIACHEALRGGETLHLSEAKNLLKDLSETKLPYTCPHGRPTLLKMTERELLKYFKRVNA